MVWQKVPQTQIYIRDVTINTIVADCLPSPFRNSRVIKREYIKAMFINLHVETKDQQSHKL